MKILIVTRCFFPHGDATSGVVENLAKALICKQNDVTVLSITSYSEDEKIKKWESINVKNIYIPESRLKDQIKKELKNTPIHTGFIATKKIAMKIYGKIIPEYIKLSLNPILTKGFKKIIYEELKHKKYELCLLTMMPHEAVWAMHKLYRCEGIETPHAVLQYDTYWDQQELPDCFKKYRFKFEQDIAKRSLFVMTTPQIVNANIKKNSKLEKKLISSEFPMVEKHEEIKIVKKDNKTHCTFLGKLYPNVRPPEKIIWIISKMRLEDVIFDFYGAGQELITAAKDYSEAEHMVKLHGTVGSKEARTIRDNTDILVNIDNTNLSQVPSKVFEYISSCKPIINFYFDDRSPSLEYLKKYPVCLNINVNKDVDFDSLSNFLISTNKVEISFEQIQNLFVKNTPEYVANQLLSAYKNAIAKEGTK